MLYEKFGVPAAGIDPAPQQEMVRMAEETLLEQRDDLDTWVNVVVSGNISVAIRHYLCDDHAQARHWAERAVASAEQYFFGDWRTRVRTDEGRVDPEWWHGRESWLHDFRGALCWATVLGRWDDVRRLATYPDDRRAEEDLDAKPALRRLVIDTARYLRGEKVRGAAEACAKLDGADWRGTDALAAALDAIIAKHEARAQASLGEFFLRRHKRKNSKDVTDTISLDGTTMLNLARREGLSIELPAKVQHYYIRLAT